MKRLLHRYGDALRADGDAVGYEAVGRVLGLLAYAQGHEIWPRNDAQVLSTVRSVEESSLDEADLYASAGDLPNEARLLHHAVTLRQFLDDHAAEPPDGGETV